MTRERMNLSVSATGQPLAIVLRLPVGPGSFAG